MSADDARSTIVLDEGAKSANAATVHQIRTTLDDAGSVWVRASGGLSRAQFRALGHALTGHALHGTYGDLPRIADDPEIYASTPYPARERILWHHEAAHTHQWPHLQLFRCAVAAESGGATGTADSRRVWARLPADVAERFSRYGLRYIRNYRPHLDADWRDVFQVNDRRELAEVCGRHSIACDWLPDATLRTSLVTPATATVDGRVAFANQILLHHTSALPTKVYEAMRGMFGERDAFPRHVQFGDGTEIPDDLVGAILDLYDEVAVRWRWQSGDVLVLDNRTTAHSRDPYVGSRRIEVALGTFHPRPAAR
ncbi:TauD/TfdA family dioxygenase [Streptomyces sp. SID13588]|uniref:TauD/TfdA family dioxygenase n=1 Tax=Streptomyces sp. SID13588 TaxID=2706051 RepID=UPI0013C87FD4|nr:TauD/TfdA family dioxygenase [Streptomyces sp. SID13588]NEA73787.1 TauD/TfdA family dioxygenase [Streptomyces sp. SID13588]